MSTSTELVTRPVSFNPVYLGLRDRVREALPDVVQANRERMLTDRKLPEPVVTKLQELGVFAIALPADMGGLGLTSPEQNDIVETLSRIDASVGWCAMIGMDSGIYAGYLAERVTKDYFDTPGLVTAGWIHPQGVGIRRGDTVEFSGTWQFGSGIDHADRIMAGIKVYSNDEDLAASNEKWEWRIAAIYPDDVKILDTWYSTGLEGSGSRHYTADMTSVPWERTLSFSQPKREGPLFTGRDAILRKMPGVPIGIAVAALEVAMAAASSKYAANSVDRSRLEDEIGRLVALVYNARVSVYASLQAQWSTASTLDRDDLHDTIVGAALARQNAFRTARAVVRAVYDLVGGRAIYKDNKRYSIDQMNRDIETINEHAVAQEAITRALGELLLGGTTNNPFLHKEVTAS